ncbi:AAA family ATPase [Methylobacterium sp. R2-1]|uniref:AAA family ATPase n=1 Tax=Methylobacterium sp. R2-1 TaxID=2587064 RepID=UPI0017DEE3F8|nr:AAA family ATPase [Methylobacterium sp. R2-1]MBB2963741.1 hypothetical protein [Methylobacterium sp. R2-1]
MNSPNTEVLLNRLLNETDGLHDDADVLFILTTDRPEEIEEALVSRPGRVDEAIEITNPDATCRGRLATLYGQALAFEEGAIEAIVPIGGSERGLHQGDGPPPRTSRRCRGLGQPDHDRDGRSCPRRSGRQPQPHRPPDRRPRARSRRQAGVALGRL